MSSLRKLWTPTMSHLPICNNHGTQDQYPKSSSSRSCASCVQVSLQPDLEHMISGSADRTCHLMTGMFNALNGLGGGGKQDAQTADKYAQPFPGGRRRSNACYSPQRECRSLFYLLRVCLLWRHLRQQDRSQAYPYHRCIRLFALHRCPIFDGHFPNASERELRNCSWSYFRSVCRPTMDCPRRDHAGVRNREEKGQICRPVLVDLQYGGSEL